ncbi:MAG: ribosome silencing factor [Thioalkalispiraceae bacterium]|jgi:ribosome-associated protein
MDYKELTELVVDALEDIKGIDIRSLDVRDKTTITDVMVIASGNSNRQVKALVDSVVTRCKERGVKPIGVEGVDAGEWALIDLGDVVVHVMQPSIRDFYNIEKLWGEESPDTQLNKTN